MDDKRLASQEQPTSTPSRDTSGKDIPVEDLDMYLPPSQRKKPTWRKVLRIILSIIIIGVIVLFGVYWFLLRADKTTPAEPTVATPQKTVTPKPTKPVSYQSSNLGLSFDYPKTWKISDKTNLLTVTSPVMNLTGASSNAQTGRIVMTVQPKGTAPEPLAKANAVAVLESQKINYDNPSGVQTAQTYLSYLQYASTTTHGGLDAIYVTGGLGYKYGQDVPASDIKQLDPLIMVSFEQCSDKGCAKPTPLTLSSSDWQNSSQQKTVETLLKSIRIDS